MMTLWGLWRKHPSNQTLSAYGDGELSEEETQRVTHHLDLCPMCAAIVQRDRSMGAAVRSFETVWDREHVLAHMKAAIVSRNRTLPTHDNGPLYRMGFMRSAPVVMAGLLIVLAVGVWQVALVRDNFTAQKVQQTERLLAMHDVLRSGMAGALIEAGRL